MAFPEHNVEAFPAYPQFGKKEMVATDHQESHYGQQVN
jgi:hypothetical protein